jgi:hypothetical protein
VTKDDPIMEHQLMLESPIKLIFDQEASDVLVARMAIYQMEAKGSNNQSSGDLGDVLR